MKNKLKFLIKQSLDRKINTKWFKVVNILLALLLILVMNIDRVVSYFGGNFKEATPIVIKDDVGSYEGFQAMFQQLASSLGDSTQYDISLSTDDIESLKNELNADSKNKIVVWIQQDDTNYMKATIYSYNEVSTITTELIATSLNSVKSSIAAYQSGLSSDQVKALTSSVTLETNLLNPDAKNAQGKDFMEAGIILIFILPCFFLIILLVQMIGGEVNDEKSSRSMEIIISNVPPKVHFLSKVIASSAFVFIQGLLVLVYSAIAYGIRNLLGTSSIATNSSNVTNQLFQILQSVKDTGIINKLLEGLPIIIVLMVFSFLAYAIIAGVLASMTTSFEDFQQLQSPIMIIMVIGYYLAIMAVTFTGSVFIKVMSFVPLFSFLISPVLYMIGQVTLWEMGISALLLVLFTYVVFKYGLRIYKVGILNYSSSKLWKKMFHSLKN